MVSINSTVFLNRIEQLYGDWESEEDNLWGGVDCIAVIVGRDDDIVYAKSTALQTWLFSYELTDTLLLFCSNELHILTSKKKAEFLRPLESVVQQRADLPRLILHIRNKVEGDLENFKIAISAAENSKSGSKVGVFAKDDFSGDFVEQWKAILAKSSLEQVDVSAAFAYTSAVKDASEVQVIKKASQFTCNVFNKYVKKEIVTVVDEEKRLKHVKLADGIEKAVTEDKQLVPPGVDQSRVEICYPPIIQSGGKYVLKFSTVSSEDRLHFGTILCCLGVRYQSYCSNICRTMFVEPSQELQDNYTFLLSVYEQTLSLLKHDTPLADVYSKVHDFVQSNRPDLKDYFTKSLGFATGLEFREPSLQIHPRCSLVAKKGMVFNVNLGFANLTNSKAEDEAGQVYALFIGDTVLVNEDEPATELTAASKKKLSSIAIFLGNEEDEEEPRDELTRMLGARSTTVLDTRTRTEIPGEDRRKKHQQQLGKLINEEAKKRLLDGIEETLAKRPKLSSMMSYKQPTSLPVRENDVLSQKIFVDRKHETIILPIFGIPTPFHISMVKNFSKSEEGEYTYLRINLFYPGSTMGRMDGVVFSNPDATYVKELSFCSSNSGIMRGGANLSNIFFLMKDIQKTFKTREQEKKELEGFVEQDRLVISTSRSNPRLKDLYMRPVLGARRVQGVLEAHTNGLRYTTLKGDKVDIIYNNVKHCFFQPSKGEMIVLLHFHLKHPVIIGKKKHKDIQFYTEVGEIMHDLGRAQHMHDRDDLMAEQAERELRQKLDNAFDSFRKKLEQIPQSHLEFEKPFRDLGFPGVPFRSSVFLVPTTYCLVHLSELPPFIVTLDEVELVHFERVQFHLKNFDLVLVFKDYKRKVAMISSIPMKSLDQVKEWLNSCDIKYTEGVQSLNWTKIMKTINDDPQGFFDNGGWSFLDPESENESGEDDDSDDQSEEYVPSDDDDSAGFEDDEEDSDEDYTSISENSDSEFEEEDESDEESGKDWDELEEEAAEADRERMYYSDEEDESRPQKKRKLDHKSSSHHSSNHKPSKPAHKSSKPSSNHSSFKAHKSSSSGSHKSHHKPSPSKKRRHK